MPSAFNIRQPLALWLSRQRWLPYKNRRSILKRFHPALLHDHAFEVDFYGEGLGLRFAGNISNYIDRLVFFCGAHEKYMLHFLQDYVRRLRAAQPQAMLTYVDVGANAGNHTIFMSRLVDRVIAFEPFERVRTQLQNNLALNRIENVTLCDFGLSDENGTLPFYAAPESNLGAASFQASHKQDNYYLGDMKLRNGDEVMREQGATVDIVKADVEGYEAHVLRGLRETIARDRPLLIVELTATTRAGLGSAEAFAALFPAGYRFYYFARGSNDSGRYRLAPYEYGMTPRIEDVIACPDDRFHLMP